MSAARSAAITARHAMMIEKASMTIELVMTEGAGATGRAVHLPTRNTAAVAAIRTDTALHAHIAIAAKNTAVVTVHGPQLKRASTTTMLMSTATESQNLGRDESTETIKTSIVKGPVTGHARRTESGINATAKTETKTMITSVIKSDQGTKTRSADVVATVRSRKMIATTTTTGTAHLDEAAKIKTETNGTEMTAAEKTAARIIATQSLPVLRRMM